MEAKIYNFQGWLKITHPDAVSMIIERLLKIGKFKILKTADHHFQPRGYTKLWLLAESHAAIHTFPEEQKTYIELSSCVEQPFKKFLEHYKQDYREVIYEHTTL